MPARIKSSGSSVGSSSSPPLHMYKSKQKSKSKRIQSEHPGHHSSDRWDLVLLAIYYVGLYAFFAAFWFAAWFIYLSTVPEGRARYPPLGKQAAVNQVQVNQSDFDIINGTSRSSIIPPCNCRVDFK